MEITQELVNKLNRILDEGLVSGLGQRTPGRFCVEAAVCYALNLPHGDDPGCVSSAVRHFKIRLNDAQWSSPKARAEGMRRCAIAQLGSRGIVNDRQFAQIVSEQVVRLILPILLEQHGLSEIAERCRADGNREAALTARDALREKSCTTAAAAAHTAAAAAHTAADAAAYAAEAAAIAAVAVAAAIAAVAVAVAEAAAAEAAAADAAAAEAAAADAARDKILNIAADIAVQALITCGSPGAKFL